LKHCILRQDSKTRVQEAIFLSRWGIHPFDDITYKQTILEVEKVDDYWLKVCITPKLTGGNGAQR
jgi:hypothetical protein